ncbi:MAG: hypothetical protein AAB834_01185, partial [Patescibacteria group bacterium]
AIVRPHAGDLLMPVGKAAQLRPVGTVNIGSANEQVNTGILGKFKSSDPTVAFVDPTGVVTALSGGTVRLGDASQGNALPITMTAVEVDLDLANISEESEIEPHALVVNADYDEGNTLPDNADSDLASDTGIIVIDEDVLELATASVGPDNALALPGTEVKFSQSGVGQVRVLAIDGTVAGSTSIELYSPSNPNINAAPYFNSTSGFNRVFVEGIIPGVVKLRLSYISQGQEVAYDELTLNVIKLELVRPSYDALGNFTGDLVPIAADEYLLASNPRPVIQLEPLAASDVSVSSDGIVSLTVSGNVRDALADIAHERKGDISELTLHANGNELATIALSRDTAYESSNSSVARPYAFQSQRFSRTLTFQGVPGANIITITTAPNAAANRGEAAITINLDRNTTFTGGSTP